MNEPLKQHGVVKSQLGLWDAVSIIVGIVVGVSIFKVPQLVFGNVETAWGGLAVWGLGGVLSLIGALCYAELATTYPRSGGDYVYLSRAYGSWVGFLFGWAQLAVILTGSIGIMAFAFADYGKPVFGLDQPAFVETVVASGLVTQKQFDDVKDKAAKSGDSKSQAAKLVELKLLTRSQADDLLAKDAALGQRANMWGVALAISAVVVLSLMNLMGVVFGKTVQNALTVAKIIGVGAIIYLGFSSGESASLKPSGGMTGPGFGLALVFVLYAYGGWNDAAFVASEVRNSKRNLPRALILGTVGITLIYLLVNMAYLWVLGFDGVRGASAPAAAVANQVVGKWGATAISVLVMVSALGAVNGLIFTGSRIYASLGADHSVFAALGRWHPKFGAPVWSLGAQAIIAVLLIVAVGTTFGRNSIDGMLTSLGRSVLPWDDYGGGFETLLAGTAPVFWLFFLLTGLSLFTLREKDHGIHRPFSVPFYPFLPFIFCLMSAFMLYSSINYAKGLALIGIVPLLLGLPLYAISRRTSIQSSVDDPLPDSESNPSEPSP